MSRDSRTKRYAEQLESDLSTDYATKPSGGTTGNFVSIDANGDLADSTYTATDFVQTTAKWKDINIGGVNLSKGASAPDEINLDTTSIKVLGFDGGATTESASGAFELQHDYIEGTDLTPHIHWYPTTAAAGDVKWQLEYYIRIGDTVKQTGTLDVTAAAGGTAWVEKRNNFSDISGTNLTIAAQIHFRIFRDPSDAADTYGDDAAVGTFGIHYQVNDLGSSNITTK